MPERDDRAASERATAQIRAVAATVRAPARLRAAVAQERLARGPSRPRRLRGILVAGAGAALALAVVLLLVAGSSETPGGSVADAAQVALRAPTGGPPSTSTGGYGGLSAGGVTFPDYARAHGWRAVGTRTDRVAGRKAVTVIYARGPQRVGYTIVDGVPLSVPQDARRIAYEGLDVAVLRDGDARYITWERDGRTCVLATRGAGIAGLLKLAADG